LSAIDRELVTVKTAEEASPTGLPVTVIVYAPTGTLATTNEPVIDPSIIEQASEPIEPLSDNEHVESLDEKPDPVTCTVLPTEAETGSNVIVRPLLLVTVKVADVESPSGLPVAVIV
jgi:hypothetical protein